MINSSSGGFHFYSAGYAATVYLDQKLRQENSGLKDLLKSMQDAGSSLTFEQALKKTNASTYSVTKLMNDFKHEGAALIDNIINNVGVGAIFEVTAVNPSSSIWESFNKCNNSK
jgi:hypothetical protein